MPAARRAEELRSSLLNGRATPSSPPASCARTYCSTRYVVVLWSWLGLVLVYAMRVNLSVAIDPMAAQFGWDNDTRGFVLSAFFIGYLFGQVPGGLLATRYGAKWVFGLGVFSTALLTLFLPLAACGDWLCPDAAAAAAASNNSAAPSPSSSSSSSPSPSPSPSSHHHHHSRSHLLSLDLVRVLMGLFEAVTYPSLMALLGEWSPPDERSRIVGLAFSGAQIGTAVAFPLSCYIASRTLADPAANLVPSNFPNAWLVRWPGVFYAFGLLGCLWFLGWSRFVYSSPAAHPRISDRERREIEDALARNRDGKPAAAGGGGGGGRARARAMPPASIWRGILTNRASIAVLVAHFTNNWSLYLMLTWMPTYMSKMLHYDLKSAGVLFVPYLAMAVVTWLAGALADRLIARGGPWWSRRRVRILVQLTGNLIPAAAFLVLGFVTDPSLALAVMIVAVSASGAAYPGYSANVLEICPNYAGVFYSVSNTLATVPGIAAPIIAGAIVKSPPTEGQWRAVFGIAAGMYVLGDVVYVCLAESEPQAALGGGGAEAGEDRVAGAADGV